MATSVATDSLNLWDVPEEWSLEEAATVPVVYATAYYALVARGDLKRGERVLIHSGSGGVGQAAITIALSMGCEVFTTVGSHEKKEFLKMKFPQLKDTNFSNSRDTTFEQDILHATNGEGVHVVLNSLADEKLTASLKCLAKNGRFLEIGKYDLVKNSPLGMEIFLKNVEVHGILLDELFSPNGDLEEKLKVVHLLKKGIADGIVKPLNRVVFNYDQPEQAFRYMASGRHMRKVILKIKEEEMKKKVIPSPTRIRAIRRTYFDPRKSYIITGGLGGFGLELCQWLIDRGAKNIILTSRTGLKTGYQKFCCYRWKMESVNIAVTKLNASKPDECRELLKFAAVYGPIGGIFNLAAVLRDAFLENQTVESFIEVCEPKVESTKNLDALSRKLCPELDWFVCFSSVSCGRGNAGQSNYGYANSVMERICENRKNDGLPGLAIQWGAIGDVGMVQNMMGSDVVIQGTIPQKIMLCLTVLDKFLQQCSPVVSSLVPYQPSKTLKKSEEKTILSVISNMFGIEDISSLNSEVSLGELGIDSIIVVELRMLFERKFGINLSVSELHNLKIKDLNKFQEENEKNSCEKSKKPPLAKKEKTLGLFNCFTKEDLIPNKTIIHMNAVTSGLPLFIVHPMEGTTIAYRPLAESLVCPVYGIQSTPEVPTDSVESVAAWYWKRIKSNSVYSKSIHLAGYSFGAIVAFEMVSQAERNPDQYPEIKSLVFLDSSPSSVKSLTHVLYIEENASLVNSEIKTLNKFANQFDESIHLVREEMVNLKSYADRIRYAANKIVTAFPRFQSVDIQTAFMQIDSKKEMTLKYIPKHKIKLDSFLIKASENEQDIKSFGDDYNLAEICEGKITIYTVKGNHSRFLQHNTMQELSTLLNEILSHSK